jgi:hypothetical protein
MPEDTYRTLLYVDMMGFAALTEKYPNSFVEWKSDDHRFQGTSSSETSNQFMRFNRILESAVFHYSLNGTMRAMLFSDCAFLEFDNSLLCALATTELMRSFILERIPVRMGIGRGTFNPVKFSTDLTNSTIVTRSLFFGTAVVRAHAAERCNEPGLRIFMHSSVEPDLNLVQCRIRALPLTDNDEAKWELDFLYEPRPAHEQPSVDQKDRELFAAVAEMSKLTMPERAKRHYTETITAMNRMRTQNNRPQIH